MDISATFPLDFDLLWFISLLEGAQRLIMDLGTTGGVCVTIKMMLSKVKYCLNPTVTEHLKCMETH